MFATPNASPSHWPDPSEAGDDDRMGGAGGDMEVVGMAAHAVAHVAAEEVLSQAQVQAQAQAQTRAQAEAEAQARAQAWAQARAEAEILELAFRFAADVEGRLHELYPDATPPIEGASPAMVAFASGERRRL